MIIGALNITGNQYDGHTLEAVLEQQQWLSGHLWTEIFVDRGYRGVTKVGQTMVHSPKAFSKKLSRYKQNKLRKGFQEEQPLNL